MVDVFTNWDPKHYLAHYYSEQELVEDEIDMFDFIFNFLKRENQHFDKMLDFGSGPTVHRLIPFVPFVNEVHVSDHLQSNLDEINTWLSSHEQSHNWKNQIKHILAIEKKYMCDKKHFDSLTERIELLKKRIHLSRCDIFNSNPLDAGDKFDLVTSFYCADSIVSSKVRWRMAMKNLLHLVKPGGSIILSALRLTKYYKIQDQIFPSPNLHENDFIDILISSGFEEKSIKYKIISSNRWKDDGINSLLALSAKLNETNGC